VDVGHDLIEVAAAAFRQFVLLKTCHCAEMLAYPRKRLGQMRPGRQVFGEQILEIAKEGARLSIALEALALPLILAAMREAFQGIQALVDCHAMFVRECGRRHCGRLRPMIFSSNARAPMEFAA
jgi:hypothetical protein